MTKVAGKKPYGWSETEVRARTVLHYRAPPGHIPLFRAHAWAGRDQRSTSDKSSAVEGRYVARPGQLHSAGRLKNISIW